MPLDPPKKIAERLKAATDHLLQLCENDDTQPISQARIDLYKQRFNDAVAIILQLHEQVEHSRLWMDATLCILRGTVISEPKQDLLKKTGEPLLMNAARDVVMELSLALRKAQQLEHVELAARVWYAAARLHPHMLKRLSSGPTPDAMAFKGLEAAIAACELADQEDDDVQPRQ